MKAADRIFGWWNFHFWWLLRWHEAVADNEHRPPLGLA
jgi:hypothetical protein